MCGIIGYIGSQDPKGILLDGLKRLEYRGYDSAGIAILEGNNVEVHRCEGRIHKLEEKLTDHQFKGSLGIGHTRWATHGAPTENNAHPHRVGHVTVVHNGIIENYFEHRESLLKSGRKILTDTDTEIVAHLLDIEVEKGRPLAEALSKVLPLLQGSYAFVVVNDREPDVLVGVRKGAPLLAAVGNGENFVASDVQAILHRTKKVIYLNDDHFVVCRRDGVEVRTTAGKKVDAPIKTIDWTPDQLEKAGYRHYMLKEIHEQSQAITQTIQGNIHHTKGIVTLAEIAPWLSEIKPIKRISIVACGTARHAGLVGKAYIERIARIPVDVDFGSEFRYREPILEDGTLVVSISQSGETADTLAAVKEAMGRKVPTLAICNVRDSSLARESNSVLYTSAGPEIGVASTKAFTTQLASLYMLAIELGHRFGGLPEKAAAELTSDLVRLPLLMDRVLQTEKAVEAISAEHQDKTFFFFLGRGVNYPIALEGALKLKEISYLHAEGYPAGEMKHGPIALIDRHTSVVVLAPKDLGGMAANVYEKVMSNLQEVKSRGASVYSIGTEGDERLKRESDYFTAIPSSSWALAPMLLSVPLQFFAYYMALAKGTDVDKPRNLAKSVTVE